MDKWATQELRALKLLQGHPKAVQLLAEGQLRTAAAGGTPGSSNPPQVYRCAVLKRFPSTLHVAIQQLVRCSEDVTKHVARQLLELLVDMQSGLLGCFITHRDLKPGNVLVDGNGTLAVADFGSCSIAAAPAAAAAAATAAGPPSAAVPGGSMQPNQQQQQPAAVPAPPMFTGIGTSFYAAPEVYGSAASGAAAVSATQEAGSSNAADPHQCAGNSSSSSSRGYDASVDVFSVGVIVLEMLAGSVNGLCEGPAPKTVEQAQQWQEALQAVVDGSGLLPTGVSVSAAALDFIGCCCGVGSKRTAAAAMGEPKRLTPQQLLAAPWLRKDN
jgi:serine/threonine protein kinase